MVNINAPLRRSRSNRWIAGVVAGLAHYFGIDVNVAARLADAAKPGEILVSDRVFKRLLPGTAEARKRRFSAKGAPKGMGAFAVARAPAKT